MLEYRSVTKSFGSVPAVRGVDLTVQEGEFFSLLGPSGCGKTTLLRMLGGFESPTSGEIFHRGVRLDTRPAHRRPVNLVFQRYALFPHLTVWENVAFGLQVKAVPAAEVERRVAEMLGLVQMQDFGGRAVTTLSGGQQQRIALARALVNEPELLLLDEPLSALDLKLRQQMQVELRGLQRRLKRTFIFVTHDQDEALTLSDRIAVMNQGVVQQVGTPQEIYEYPRTLFVARFIGSINEFSITVQSSSSSELVCRPSSNEVQFSIRPPRDGARPLPTVREGERGLLLVRPEKIRVVKAAGETPARRPNSVEGVLREVLYQGPMTQFFVDLPPLGGTAPSIVAAQPNTAVTAQRSLLPGDRVLLSWDPEDCFYMASAEEMRE